MKGRLTKRYSFSSAAHWEKCLSWGLETEADGGLRLSPPLARQPRPVSSGSPVSAVASDGYGMAVWRESLPAAHGTGIASQDEFDVKHGPFDADDMLSASRRLLVDRYYIWAFAPEEVARYDRSTLEREQLVRLGQLPAAEAARIADIAPDGKCGIWCLLTGKRRSSLARIDSAGRWARQLSLPPEIEIVAEIATLDRGATLALFAPSDRRLFLINAETGALRRAIYLGMLDPARRFERLASDGRGRLAFYIGSPDGWATYILNRVGEIIQGPLEFDFAGAKVEPTDIALGGDRLWIASDKGLWQVEQASATQSERSAAELMTPLLHSPPGSGSRGWQQAEIEVDLPEGASVEVLFRTTDDPRIADDIRQISTDESLPHAMRMASIWSLFGNDGNAPQPFVATGGPNFSGRLEIPLFIASGAYLVMRLKIDLPPLVRSPILRKMRLLYPEHSLMRHLPAVYSSPEGDEHGVLRRLVGVAEATSLQLDARIASIGRMIEAETAPQGWLDYIGSWLDLPWHDALHPGSKRLILRRAGELLAWRGTRRGLISLLECLAGPGGYVEVDDVMADHTAMVLGGGGAPGTPIRGLLAGQRRDAPTLSGRAVLGHARLGCKDDSPGPLDILTPWVRIAIEGIADYRTRNLPHLAHMLTQYLPAGIRNSSQWRVAQEKDSADPEALVLEAHEPGALSRNVEVGRTTLAGRSRKPIGSGIEMGFQMR